MSVSHSVESASFVTPWTITCQAHLSMELYRQEYWNTGVGIPFSGDFPDPAIRPRSPALQADSLLSEPPGSPLYKDVDPKSSFIDDRKDFSRAFFCISS